MMTPQILKLVYAPTLQKSKNLDNKTLLFLQIKKYHSSFFKGYNMAKRYFFSEGNLKACVRYFLKIHYTSDLIT